MTGLVINLVLRISFCLKVTKNGCIILLSNTSNNSDERETQLWELWVL